MAIYKIGEAARLLGLTTQALRFYEQEGVITPQKSEGGTRCYDVGDMVRLLSFKKYRQAHFSVQDVVAHFKEDTLENLSAQLKAQQGALEAESAMLLRRAAALQQMTQTLASARTQQGDMTVRQRPPLWLFDLSLDRLHEATPAQRQAMQAYIDAMPPVGISFMRGMEKGDEVVFRFCVSDADARAWSLPTQGRHQLAPVRCVHSVRRFACMPWADDAVRQTLDAVRAAGFAVAASEPIFGVHIASETLAGKVFLYAQVDVPIL